MCRPRCDKHWLIEAVEYAFDGTKAGVAEQALKCRKADCMVATAKDLRAGCAIDIVDEAHA